MFWLETTISRDEGAFGFIGMMWLRGFLPTYWFDIQGPLTYAFYAIPIFLFGNSIIPIRLLNNLLFILSYFALYSIASSLSSNKIGKISAIFYGFSMNIPILEGMTTVTETLSTPFMIFSVYTILKYKKRNQPIILILAGVLMSIATLIRFIHLIGFLILFVILFKIENPIPKMKAIKNQLLIIMGASIVFSVTIFYFVFNNDIVGFFELYQRSLGFSTLVHVFQDVPIFIKYLILAEALPLWIFVIFGTTYLIIRNSMKSRLILLFWTISYLLISFIPPTFGHRIIPLLPIASLIAGIGMFNFIKWLKNFVNYSNIIHFRNKIISVILISISILGLLTPSIFYVQIQYPQMNINYNEMEWAYADSNYETQISVSEYIKSHTSSEDRIFVHGWASEIYLLTGKNPPTKYVWSLDYLPNSELKRLEKMISDRHFRYLIAYSAKIEDLYNRAQSTDEILKYFFYYYYLTNTINNAKIFSKFDDFNSSTCYSFIDNFNDATILYDQENGETTTKSNVIFNPRIVIRSIANDTKYCIQHVPLDQLSSNIVLKSYIKYKIQIPSNSTLSFSIGIDPSFWETSYGTTFEILILNDEGEHTIFKQTINPKSQVEDKQWNDFRVNISKFSNEQIEIVFIVSPGLTLKNEDSFALWGNPRIVVTD